MSKLYVYKPLDLGFIILCHDGTASRLWNTISSIQVHYPNCPCICATGESTTEEELKTMQKKCVTRMGKNTITSLINAGMKSAPASWNFIVIAGSYVRGHLDQKFSYFVEEEKDVLFPIVDKKMNFVDGTINGILMHKKTFKEVGEMGEYESLELCKLEWAVRAIENGCRFKAIAGTKIC